MKSHMTSHTAYITHPDCQKHDMGMSHPESPQRLEAIEAHLDDSGLMARLRRIDAPMATDEHLARVHEARYIQAIRTIAPATGWVELDPDTVMNPGTLDAALRAAGAVVRAVEGVVAGEFDSAFCAVRPPGHHARPGRAMGFCLFNNIAVGAAHALHALGLQRVAICDFDVHHGNGTEEMFRDEPRVLMCSTFQHPFYPYMGADSGNSHIINVTLGAGSGGEAMRQAIQRHWLPALEAYRPELLLISAGFDAHAEDGLAGLRWQEEDYAWITRQLRGVADACCQGRIVSVLEGGYNVDALARSVEAHLTALL